jgi:hypothetical protein
MLADTSAVAMPYWHHLGMATMGPSTSRHIQRLAANLLKSAV